MTRFFFNSPLIHGYLGYYPRFRSVSRPGYCKENVLPGRFSCKIKRWSHDPARTAKHRGNC